MIEKQDPAKYCKVYHVFESLANKLEVAFQYSVKTEIEFITMLSVSTPTLF